MSKCVDCSHLVAGSCAMSGSSRLMDEESKTREKHCIEFKDKTRTPLRFSKIPYTVLLAMIKEGNRRHEQ